MVKTTGKITQIIQGWTNEVKDHLGKLDDETKWISELRLNHCKNCELREGKLCSPNKQSLHVKTNQLTKGCGCNIFPKSKSKDSTCPLGKWSLSIKEYYTKDFIKGALQYGKDNLLKDPIFSPFNLQIKDTWIGVHLTPYPVYQDFNSLQQALEFCIEVITSGVIINNTKYYVVNGKIIKNGNS